MDFGKSGRLLLLFGFLSLCESYAKDVYYNIVLYEKNFTKLCETKSILTANGSFPGPSIEVRQGDVAYITIHNNGNYGVIIHWHGVRQPRDPWSDGPENITQCPIRAGTSFTQRVNFTSEVGTLWWHAHSDWTRATVHGAILILPEEKYPYPKPDGEEIFIIGEWYKGDVMEIMATALKTGGNPNTSDSYTINGQPGDFYDCSNETTYRFLVDYGKTYLFRIINAAMNEEHYFGIANHTLTVVGSDGAYLKYFNTSYLVITPGQTFDVLITADRTPDEYYIGATAYHDGADAYDNTTATAILQYSGNYTPSSPIPFPYFPYYNDSSASFNFTMNLKSLNSSVPTNVDKRIYMTVAVNELPCPSGSNCSGPYGNKFAASLNNVSFVTPSIDILQAYYYNISGVFTQDFPFEPPYYYNFTGDVGNSTIIASTGTRVIMLDYNGTVELVWQGTNTRTTIMTAENHPMHLHGFSFYVVGIGWGNFNNETDPSNYNLVDPPEVNTVALPKNGWVAVRWVADNPGVWFMHCHFERHTSWGMDTVLIVRDGGTNETSMIPPPSYMPPCNSTST